MPRNYILSETQRPITGMFWVPGDEEEKFAGTLCLEAGKRARLTTSKFNFEGLANLFPGAAKSMEGSSRKLEGVAVKNSMELPAHQVLQGHDEHGREITLIHVSSNLTHSTFALSSSEFSCQGAIFGCHADLESTKFGGIRLAVDHLDEWVGRCAFQSHKETSDGEDGKRHFSKITIPIARELAIPLGLPGHRASEFFCSWTLSESMQRFELGGKVFLDLQWEQPLGWWDLLKSVHQWEWFFSLATRDTVNLSYLKLIPNTDEGDEDPPHGFEVWLPRRDRTNLIHPGRRSHDFHFTYADVENDFAKVIENWQRLQFSWQAVLHRFFAVTAPRDLWMNERFLFFAQAVESMYRAKNQIGKQNVDLAKAAKMAWEGAPPGLQSILGKKRVFIDQFRKTRNYWTHYGEPGPENDPDVLADSDLMYFSEKLRFLIEANLLSELGLSNHCVEKVWRDQWRMRLIDFAK